jgi:hypothetical protein
MAELNNPSAATTSKEQAEMIRMYLREIAGNTRIYDRDLRQFAA